MPSRPPATYVGVSTVLPGTCSAATILPACIPTGFSRSRSRRSLRGLHHHCCRERGYHRLVLFPPGGPLSRNRDHSNAGGLPVSSTVSPANSLAAWKFTGHAGQQLTLLPIAQNGFTVQSAPHWLLQDPTGRVLFDNGFTAPGTIVLPIDGAYYLVVYGWYNETSLNANVNFQATLVDGTFPPPTGTALSLGSVTSGTVSSGTPAFYTFSLPVASQLIFDAQTQNDQLRWSLTNGATAFVANRSFMSSDSAEITDASLALPPGQYQLAIAAASGSGLPFQFNLINFTNATALTPGSAVVNTLTPANGTVLYQFGAVAGDTFFFDGQPSSGFTYAPYARLYGPYGNLLVSTPVDGDVDTFPVAQTGTYTLAIEGRIYDTHTSGTYAFNLVPQDYPTNNLTLGDTVTGSIPVLGQRNVHLFSLPVASTLYMDVPHQRGLLLAARRALGPGGQLARFQQHR